MVWEKEEVMGWLGDLEEKRNGLEGGDVNGFGREGKDGLGRKRIWRRRRWGRMR